MESLAPSFLPGDAEHLFRGALREQGLEPPRELVADGQLHRCDAVGKPGRKDGSYLLHLDGVPSGGFQNWRDGAGWQTWCSRSERQLSAREVAEHRARIATARRAAELERTTRATEARATAGRILAESAGCGSHPYLTKKGVGAHSLLISRGSLVAPLRDVHNTLHSLQFIRSDGRKSFLAGGRVHGCFVAIGVLDTASTICVAEGFATAASVFECTGYPAVAALTCGNLLVVAGAIHDKFPDARVIICADDDFSDPKNPGMTAAREAAATVGGLVAVPKFGDDRPSNATDFNDLARVAGVEAVRASIDGAHSAETPSPADGSTTGEKTLTMASEPWAEPEALPDTLPGIPAFNDRLLPDAFRPWLSDLAERTQCPPEYAAVGAIVGFGSVVGRGCTIRPKRHDDWTVVPTLWGAVVGPPSSLKSPALAESLRPVRRLIVEASEAHRHRIEAHAASLAEADARRSVVKERMKKAAKTGEDMAGLRAEFEAAADPETPTERRYIVNDATVEKLGELLNENPRGLLHYRDELSGWLATLDRDGHENDRAFFLEAWDGRLPYTYDRIGRGTLNIKAACVSMLGGIQLGPLAQYIRAAFRGGLGDDGLMQRFQLLVFPDPPKTWRNVDRRPDGEARERAFNVFRRVDTLTPDTLGAREEDGFPVLRFDAGAQDFFDTWRDELMRRLRTDQNHPVIESHLGKYPSLLPSLALLFHLADAPTLPPGPVTLVAAQRAAAWCDLLEGHARRVYHAATALEIAAARTALARLNAGALPNSFTARDLYRKQWTGIHTPADADGALDVLEEHGWVRRVVVPADPAGGYPRTRVIFYLHPALRLAGKAAT